MRARTRQAPRSTGPTRQTRDALWLRAGGRCELCGRTLADGMFSRHHRRPRRMGGSRLTWINGLANLLLVCGSATSPDGCHLRIERNRQAAYDAGWLLRDRDLPGEIPVETRHGLVYLTDDGDYAPGAP